jgi:putative DNA primase/helicase
MDGNKDMARFLQILSGYALFGGNPEQVFIILNGDGANGKSTFVNTLEHILKDYAATTSPATLIKPAFSKSGGAAAPDLMRLFRKRLVLCNEWDENAYLNESLMKSLTGASDPISVRALYANNYLTFKPDFLIMIATNHIPKIISMDYGIWRRLIIIPFPVNFDDPEHISKKDRYLYDHFINKEAAGIFNWMIEGYRLWREQGVIDSAPEIVLNTKQEYKKEMDIIAQFVEECCVIDEPKSKITSAELYAAYTQWCKDNGNHVKANRTFSRNMIERGHKRTRIGTVNGFKDIRLLTLSEKAEQYQQVLNDERDDAEITTRLN